VNKYQEFTQLRYDIVIKFHLLKEEDFDFNKVKNIIYSDNYSFLRNLLIQKSPKLIQKNFFDISKYLYIENQILFNENWLKKNPYEINSFFYGRNVKRLIISIKYNKNLFWCYNDSFRVRKEYNKNNFYLFFPDWFKKKIDNSEKTLISKMEKMKYFDEEFRVNNAKYKNFFIKLKNKLKKVE
jgi:hypothetical protein